MSETNTFAEGPSEYVVARPQYPEELFRWLAGQCASTDSAWDCATGNGQAAVGLSPFFRRVCATDISAEQIAHGIPRPNIEYSVQPAEETRLGDGSFDLVVVAQALHWFDFARFWPAVRRVTRRDGFFCAWGYDWLRSTPEVEDLLVAPFRALVAPFWVPNNRILWDGYVDRDVAFPFPRVETPSFVLRLRWRLDRLLAYLMTWSAFKRSRSDADAKTAIDGLFERVRTRVPPSQELSLTMPLRTIAGRVI